MGMRHLTFLSRWARSLLMVFLEPPLFFRLGIALESFTQEYLFDPPFRLGRFFRDFMGLQDYGQLPTQSFTFCPLFSFHSASVGEYPFGASHLSGWSNVTVIFFPFSPPIGAIALHMLYVISPPLYLPLLGWRTPLLFSFLSILALLAMDKCANPRPRLF